MVPIECGLWIAECLFFSLLITAVCGVSFYSFKVLQMDSESNQWIENIPIDIQKDILMRLPVKSIGRSMLVSKRWYSSVKSAPFIKIHLNHSKTKDLRVLIVQEGSYTIFAESKANLIVEEHGKIPFPILKRDLHVLGSCRGLVLVQLGVEPRGSLVLLWNPLLEKFKVIDKILDDRVSIFALGFHEASNDYRIVRIGRKPENNLSKVVDIYSFNKDSWQGIGETLTDGSVLPTIAFPKHMATYVDGIVHWIANYDPRVGVNHYTILSFEFDKEVFKDIELPECNTDLENPELKEFDGKLVLSCYHVGQWELSMLTWVMMNYPLVGS